MKDVVKITLIVAVSIVFVLGMFCFASAKGINIDMTGTYKTDDKEIILECDFEQNKTTHQELASTVDELD